jgi:hypothetical protein
VLRSACIAIACAACTSSPRSPSTLPDAASGQGKGDGPGAVDAPAGRVIRLLDDSAAIGSNGLATDHGYTYSTVVDGTPSTPAIADGAIAFTVPTDTSGHKQRIEYKILEAADPDGLHFDNARYSGFALQLPAGQAAFLGSTIFWQAWQGFPYGPPISLKVEKSDASPFRIRLAIRNASVGPDSTVPDITLWSGALDDGTWHQFLIYVSPRFAGGSELKLWVDGVKQLDWQGAIGYDPTQVSGAYAGLDIKDGIYQPSANNGRTLLFDHLIVSTSYALAAHELGWQ